MNVTIVTLQEVTVMKENIRSRAMALVSEPEGKISGLVSLKLVMHNGK